MRTAPGNPPEHRLTREHALALAAAEQAELDRRAAALAALRADGTFLGLLRGAPRGQTSVRWAAARQAADAAESMLGKWRRTLADVGRLLQGSDRPQVDLARVGTLLRGDSVPLAPAELRRVDRRPPWANSSEPQFSLAAVRSLIDGDLRLAERTVADIRAVRRAAEPRLERLAADLRAIRTVADPVTDAAVLAALVAVAGQLDSLREQVAADPLALRGGPPQSAEQFDPQPFDALAVELTSLGDRLASTVARRGELADRVARLGRAVDELAALESHARDRRGEVLLRSAPERLPAPEQLPGSPRSASPLGVRLRALQAGPAPDWRAAQSELTELERLVVAARRAADQVVAWAEAQDRGRVRPTGCVRPDCAGGALDQDGICETCDRAPARATRAAGEAS